MSSKLIILLNSRWCKDIFWPNEGDIICQIAGKFKCGVDPFDM